MKDEIELCWRAEEVNHKEVQPMDCLTCERIKGMGKELNYDINTPHGAFVTGYRLALFEATIYLVKHKPKSIEDTVKVFDALGRRLACALDRGVIENHLDYFLAIVQKLAVDAALAKVG